MYCLIVEVIIWREIFRKTRRNKEHFVNVGYYVSLMLLVTPRLAKNFSPYFSDCVSHCYALSHLRRISST